MKKFTISNRWNLEQIVTLYTYHLHIHQDKFILWSIQSKTCHGEREREREREKNNMMISILKFKKKKKKKNYDYAFFFPTIFMTMLCNNYFKTSPSDAWKNSSKTFASMHFCIW